MIKCLLICKKNIKIKENIEHKKKVEKKIKSINKANKDKQK